MKKLFLMTAALGLLLVSFSASALQVEPRGFTLCTGIDPSDWTCTAGSYWSKPNGALVNASAEFSCDWSGGGTCVPWKAYGHYSQSGVYGINWTCCMKMDAGEDTFTYNFQYYDPNKQDWTDAEWESYVTPGTGVGVGGNGCLVGYGIFQGRSYYGGSTWTYTDEVARCGASDYLGNTHNVKVVEYWMD